MRQLERVNKELLLVFSMLVGALLLNFLIDAQRMVLYVYTLPTVASAYTTAGGTPRSRRSPACCSSRCSR